MYGAVTKKIIIALLASMPLSIVSCSGGKSEDELNAENLLSKVKNLYADKQYGNAMEMIDSLMESFPGMIDVQRKAMHFQTLIIEKQTIQDSLNNEIAFKKAKQLEDSLSKAFKFIKTEDMVEGYHLANYVNPDQLLTTSNIEARIAENSGIYIVSALHGSSVKHTHIKIVSGNESVTTKDVPLSNPRNYRFVDGGKNTEMVTFNTTECDSLCAFVNNHIDKPIKLLFQGNNKQKAIILDSKTKTAISETWKYYSVRQQIASAEINRLKFMKKLQLARKQIKQTATNIQGDRQ